MLGKLRVLLVSIAVGSTVLVGPGASPADAAAACTVNMDFSYAPGITVVPNLPPAPGPFVTGRMVLNCPVLSPDAGLWVLPFFGVSTIESCGGGVGTMTFAAALVGPAGFGGTFTYGHEYAGATVVIGNMTWPGNARTLVATGEWLPVLVPGNCVTAPVTAGFMTGTGAFA